MPCIQPSCSKKCCFRSTIACHPPIGFLAEWDRDSRAINASRRLWSHSRHWPPYLWLQKAQAWLYCTSLSGEEDVQQLKQASRLQLQPCKSPNSTTLLWGLEPRLAPVRSGAASTPGSRQGSGGFWCRYLVRFRKVPAQIPGEVPEGSGEDTFWGSGSFCAVPEGSGADTLWGSGSFQCWYSVKFRKLRCRYLARFYRAWVQVPGEVPEVSDAATWWGSGGSRWRCVVRFRRVPGQIPCEVPEGSDAETFWCSGGLGRRRCLVRFRRVPVQIPCEALEGSGADALRNSKRFRCFLWYKYSISA